MRGGKTLLAFFPLSTVLYTRQQSDIEDTGGFELVAGLGFAF